jgi:hypothetical protein
MPTRTWRGAGRQILQVSVGNPASHYSLARLWLPSPLCPSLDTTTPCRMVRAITFVCPKRPPVLDWACWPGWLTGIVEAPRNLTGQPFSPSVPHRTAPQPHLRAKLLDQASPHVLHSPWLCASFDGVAQCHPWWVTEVLVLVASALEERFLMAINLSHMRAHPIKEKWQSPQVAERRTVSSH